MLSTVANLKAHLGIPSADTTKDALLTMLLKGSSAFIETETHRKLGVQTHDIKLDGTGMHEIMLPQYPVQSITTLEIDGEAQTIGDLDIDTETGIVYSENIIFRTGRRNVHIVFEAGYVLPDTEESGEAPDLPDDLESAAIRLAARVYERRTAEGVQSVSASSFSASYRAAIDDDLQAIISAHTKLRS